MVLLNYFPPFPGKQKAHDAMLLKQQGLEAPVQPADSLVEPSAAASAVPTFNAPEEELSGWTTAEGTVDGGGSGNHDDNIEQVSTHHCL